MADELSCEVDAVEVVPAQRESTATLKLTESACEWAEAVQLTEAKRSNYEVKLIAPGKGSTAFYTESALKTSGPKVFRAGTHMHWNHPTQSEELERPERDLDTLAAVLTSDAVYKESGSKGPGLYAQAKVFSDYAQQVEEKGAHIGLSIMASGLAECDKAGKPIMREGVPVLKEFTVAQSTDFVTRAGAGGMVLTDLTESAQSGSQSQQQEGATVTDAELKTLQESVREAKADNLKLRQRMALSEASGEVRKILSGLTISEAIKDRVAGRILAGSIPLTEAGDLDQAKLKERVEAEAKDECAYVEKLSGGRFVTGMGGATTTTTLTEAEQRTRDEELERQAASFARGLGLATKEAAAIMTNGRSAFDPTFNAAEVKTND